MIVVKRHGGEEKFNKDKIIKAVLSAFQDVDKEITEEAQNIAQKIGDAVERHQRKKMTVEEIQDFVEDKLMKSSRKDVAQTYIRYRFLHKLARDEYKELMNAVGDKLTCKNIENQNANVDEHSFGGRIGAACDYLMKEYALNYCMSPLSRQNHLNNEIYIHDLNAYAVGEHNCLSVPLDKLLATGFNTRQIDVRPAQSINTAFQLVAVIFQIQSLQQFGGVSATHLDWTMVPYVRKSFRKHFKDGIFYIENTIEDNKEKSDKIIDTFPKDTEMSIDSPEYKIFKKAYKYAMDMTIKETHQAVEGMYHNLNTLQSRSGNQLPFSSVNYGTCTLPEGRMVIKALLEVSIEGLGKLHRTSIFPCSIFQLGKGINRQPEDPNYDLFQLALKSTSLRLYPNYANIDWSGNAGYDISDPKTYFSTMGCRTANGMDINGMEQTKDGRGNICPVTIIMPTLAMKADRDVEKFMKLLDKKIGEAKDMLLERFEYICSQDANSAKFMYENGTMEGYVPEEGIRSALKHGTIVIGQLGLAETLELLIGENHTHKKGMELAKRIEQLFKDRCAEFKKKYKLNFGVYYTPAENLCYTALQKFRKQYGIIEKVSDREFFTNSMHVPVWEKVNAFEKIDIESELTGYSSAGCITYIELESSVKNNLESLEAVVNYAMDKDIPYFALNVPNDCCMTCGYTEELDETCPICGGTKIQRLRRVTGYLTGDYKTAFNAGKQQEVEMRVKHI